MTGGTLQMLAAAAQQPEAAHVVSELIALAVVLGVLVAAGWVLLFDRRRGDGVAPVDPETETERDEAA
ncbi:MAG TPA: hypothetical protein VK283_10580 [Acidimicrobiales bacterium]|nr:hypothetical protein [Acidimicrobiales bacterium]